MNVAQDEMHNSWKGLLTFPTNSSFRRIVGRQGKTVKHLQEETNSRIYVPEAGKGTTVIIIGQ
jgi:KH domain